VEPRANPAITPEPTPEERTAILAALGSLAQNGLPAAYRSAWREEGIRENSAEDGSSGLLGHRAAPE
jgi:hypothetical protein